jgi:hypothetical protein
VITQIPLNLDNHEHNFNYITKLERNQKKAKENKIKRKKKKELVTPGNYWHYSLHSAHYLANGVMLTSDDGGTGEPTAKY